MMSIGYLLFLVLSLVGLALIDYRYKLVYFHNYWSAVKVMVIMIMIFIIWDVIGIALGIFFIGSSTMLTGIRIGEFPLEELFFLALLNYSSLIIYRFMQRKAVE